MTERDLFVLFAKHKGIFVWRSYKQMFDDKMKGVSEEEKEE